ncbi:hypothetical protein [Pseudomonas sp.]|uniref:hypothetical protein n=1 Tax=Pseudomonas sp. TaxID=306 RepID=UPI00326409B9
MQMGGQVRAITQSKPTRLEATIMELANCFEQRGSLDVADNVRGALDTISRNEDFLNMSLAVLMTPE